MTDIFTRQVLKDKGAYPEKLVSLNDVELAKNISCEIIQVTFCNGKVVSVRCKLFIIYPSIYIFICFSSRSIIFRRVRFHVTLLTEKWS